MTQPALKEQTAWRGKQESTVKQNLLQTMQDATGEGPGRFLKELRQTKGISQSEAASKMSLSVGQLEAIEADNYDALPAPIYVRNYLRRYCEILDFDTEATLEAYKRFGEVEEPTLSRVSLRERLNSRHISVRWASYSVLIAIIALFAYWLISEGITDFIPAINENAADVSSSQLELPVVPTDPGAVIDVPAENIESATE